MKNCRKNKINAGLLKLDLFCSGMRIDSSCRLDKDARTILRTRGGLGSGLEMILPGNVFVNAPIIEDFVKKSPYILVKENEKYTLRKNSGIICDIILLPKPKFYSKITSSGKIMSRIGVLQGTYLAIYPTRICRFWQMQPRMSCKFCSLGLNIGYNEESDKTVTDVVETVEAARMEEKITFVHFNTGYLNGEALDELVPYVEEVKRKTGLLIGVQSPPDPDLLKYGRLKKIGVDHISFCLELFNPQRFKEVCPGKDKYIGQRKYLDTLKYCVKVFGKGMVAGEIIAGLEDPNDTIKAIEYFAKVGAVSTVCVFRPGVGTDLENSAPPRLEEAIPAFKRMYEVCLENNIPFGIAPNIKVSIVLLPEECRHLSSVREKFVLAYFILKVKLRILKLLFNLFFNLRILLLQIKRRKLL